MSGSLRAAVSAAVLLIASANAFAQQPAPAKDSKELCIVEKSVTHIKLAEDGSDDSRLESAIRITSQAGVQQYGLLRLSYAKATTALEVSYVRVRKADGSVIETSLDTIDDMPAEITRQAPEYSDLREKHIAVKGLAVGDLLELAYTLHSKPLVPGQFSFVADFDRSEISKSIVIEFEAPASLPLKVRSEKLKPQIKEAEGRRIYTWSYDVKAPQKVAAEPIAAPPDVIISTFKSWDEVGQWWSKLASESATPAPEIATKARVLTADAKTNEAKARALYNYVSSNFRYIGIGFGIGRYQPHPALDVFQNGYGDCKDKYALLAAMLKSQGIASYPALLNVERNIDPEVPSIAQFDHVILVAVVDGKEVWLDPTQEVAPFRHLAYPERDRFALVMRDKATLEKSPNAVPFPSKYEFTADAELNSKGVLKGHMTGTVSGSLAVIYRSAFRSVPQSKWQELAQGISYRQGFGGTVSNVEVTGLDDLDQPVKVTYDYERSDYSDWEQRRISPPFPATGLARRDDLRDPNEPLPQQIFLGEPYEMTFRAKVKLPSEFQAIPPKDTLESTDFIEFSNSMTVDKGVLQAQRYVRVKQAVLPQARRSEFTKLERAVYDAESNMVSLVSANGPGIVDNGDAAENANLFEQARGEMLSRRFDTAESALHQLLLRDPKYPQAHAMLGTIYLMQNSREKVAEEFNKEFQANPKLLDAYRMYASMLNSQRNYKEARDVWAKCVKNIPQAADAWQSLAELDSQLGDSRNAVTEMQRAVELNPDSTRTNLAYARLLVKNGEKEKGFGMMIKAADEDPKEDFLNTTAYEMADSSYELEKAEAYATKAVAAIESQTSHIQLANITSFDLRRMSTLTSYWDTMGWVYFRQGKYDAAEKYLRAAFELTPDAVIGAHLGQAYDKLGKTDRAMETYTLAKSLIGRRGAPDPELANLLDKATRGRTTSKFSSSDRLQSMRSIKLTLAPPRPETGEFYFLFGSTGKIEDVHFITGDKRLDTPAAIAKIKLGKFHTIPLPGSPDAKVVRRGSVFCAGTNSPCDLVLFEVRDVMSATN